MNGSGDHDSPRKSRSGETKRRADARAVPASRSCAQTDRLNLAIAVTARRDGHL